MYNKPSSSLVRAFERDRALCGETLDDIVRSTWLYAVRLCSLSKIKTEEGEIVDVSASLENFRAWFLFHADQLSDDGWHFTEDQAQSSVGTRFWSGKWHRQSLNAFFPKLAHKLRETLDSVNLEHPNVNDRTFEAALSKKLLGLALGGGGGTGFLHQAVFQSLEANDIQPSIMTGTSIGSLMGFIRSFQDHYDAARTLIQMPSWFRIMHCMKPCFGKTRHGQPAVFNFDFARLVADVYPAFGWKESPRFDELKIPFACVAGGITYNPEVVKTYEQKSGLVSTILSATGIKKSRLFSNAAQIAHLLNDQNAIVEEVIGFDPLTREMTAGNGIGFSALVPGVLNYEVPARCYKDREILDTIFRRDNLFRLVDGGVISNVPVRALQREIDTLRLGHTNVHTIGIDVFAPQIYDGVFYPLEQVANGNADLDAREAASFVRVKNLLSPVNLSPTLRQYKWLNETFAPDFEDELKVLRYVTKPLRPLESLGLRNY